MLLTIFFNKLFYGIAHTSKVELVAVIAGVVSVWCSKKENILVYPIGLINTILYTWLCWYNWQLYAEASLNLYYTIMGIYGWYCWSNKKQNNTLKISCNTRKDWLLVALLFFVCWIILFFVLKKYTNSTVPFADAFASATAYTAMWQMAKKKIEHWWWWIATNLASIPLYFYKQAVFTSVQYLVFLLIAIAGLVEWRRKLNNICFTKK